MTDYRAVFSIIVPGKPGSRPQRLQLPAESDREAARKVKQHIDDMEKWAKRAGTREVWQLQIFERIDAPEQTTRLCLGDFI
jgi:hypothetical protein